MATYLKLSFVSLLFLTSVFHRGRDVTFIQITGF